MAITFVLQLATIYVPWLRAFFRTQALGGGELAICLAAALAVFLAVEAEKAARRRWAAPMAGRARTGMPGA